ncbi:hypothetical protein DERP_012003 [Dermatophagoides pteronyssinus]|uniref:Uncharacterized protein n=1 Tax=Dermatophagoides pteronyssinus TaxID=6956 RepID=A0ABQ8IVX8_DERPT|nr:hypothetical protein DERP_012003 [Dermatophagoides pteronyssinus]
MSLSSSSPIAISRKLFENVSQQKLNLITDANSWVMGKKCLTSNGRWQRCSKKKERHLRKAKLN